MVIPNSNIEEIRNTFQPRTKQLKLPTIREMQKESNNFTQIIKGYWNQRKRGCIWSHIHQYAHIPVRLSKGGISENNKKAHINCSSFYMKIHIE